MAEHPLIRAELNALRVQLAPDLFDEIADGLHETYQAKLAVTQDPGTAARAAIAEFGDAETILAATWQHSTTRQLTGALLATGPILGGTWAASLISNHAWLWPLPIAVRVGYIVTLLITVTLLLATITGRLKLRHRQPSILAASLLLITLDLSACAATLSYSTASGQATQLALLSSLLRSALVVAALTQVTKAA